MRKVLAPLILCIASPIMAGRPKKSAPAPQSETATPTQKPAKRSRADRRKHIINFMENTLHINPNDPNDVKLYKQWKKYHSTLQSTFEPEILKNQDQEVKNALLRRWRDTTDTINRAVLGIETSRLYPSPTPPPPIDAPVLTLSSPLLAKRLATTGTQPTPLPPLKLPLSEPPPQAPSPIAQAISVLTQFLTGAPKVS